MRARLSAMLDQLTPRVGAALGLAIGVADTVLLIVLGARFRLDRLEGVDMSVPVGAFFTASFVALGHMLGKTAEARRRDRAQAEVIQAQLNELAQVQARLSEREKLSSLGQLAGAIAHEVRNPLAIIRSTIQNLGESLEPNDAAGQESCRFAIEEIDRLTRVTSSLVSFVKPLKVAKKPVRAKAILDRTELLAQRLFSGGEVRLVRAQATLDREVEVDEDLICQVLLGLLANAASMSPRGGNVVLSGEAKAEQVEFSVTDQGPGVPGELKTRIFEPFFTTREGGSGLGLAVAQQIIKAHGGSLDVQNPSSGGARFSIRLAG